MKLVVFDMDGTLIDTQALIAEHMAATFAGRGLPAPTPAQSRRVIGLSLLWGCAILFALYGLLGFVEKLLMGLGAIGVPDGLGEDVVWWYVFLWEPIWILGGALYFMTAMLFGRALRADREAGPR